MPVSLLEQRHLDEMRRLARETPEGCFIEIGVYKGGSAKVLYDVAMEQKREIYLFDTFEGIPYCDPETDEVPVGEFSDVDEDELRAEMPNAHIVKGVFPETLGEVVNRLYPVAFLHVDADQYRATKAAIQLIFPMMTTGSVAVFDDVILLKGVRKAIEEEIGEMKLPDDGGRYRVVMS